MNDDDRTPRPQSDTDPEETREWLDSLEYVLKEKVAPVGALGFEHVLEQSATRGFFGIGIGLGSRSAIVVVHIALVMLPSYYPWGCPIAKK